MLKGRKAEGRGEGSHWTNNKDTARLLLFTQQTFGGIHYMAGRVSAGDKAVGGSSYVTILMFPSCNFAFFNFTTAPGLSTHQVGPVSLVPSHTVFSSYSICLPSKLGFVVGLFFKDTSLTTLWKWPISPREDIQIFNH